MADIKKLQTRIALKYDSYSAWTSAPGKGLVLLAGEIGICQIGEVSATSRVAPTVLFKVGNGTSTFEQLPWASAKAADVYTWAKASDVVVSGKTLKFVGGDVDAEGNKIDKVVTFNFATPEEVAAAVKVVADDVADLKTDVADLKAKFTGDASVDAKLADHESRLSTAETNITNLGTNKLDKSVYDAYIVGKELSDADLKAYSDTKAGEAKSGAESTAAAALAEAKTALENADKTLGERIDALVGDNGSIATGDAATLASAKSYAEEKASAAEAAAKSHAETKASEAQAAAELTASNALSGAVTTLNAKDAELEGKIGLNETAIAVEKKAREDADVEINNKLVGVTTNVGDAISAALETAATTAQSKVDALKNAEVKENTRLIGVNAAAIADLEAEFDEDGRVTVLEAAAANHEDRLVAVEAFFDPKDAEGNSVEIDKALDTLVEIQSYITSDGTAAEKMVEDIGKNAKAIEELDKAFDAYVDAADADITALEGRADALEGRASALETLTAGFAEGETVKAKIEAAAALGQQGIDDAKDALDAADQAQKEVDALEGVVSTLRNEYDVTKQKAIDNGAAISALDGRVVTAENAIKDLQDDSHTHTFVESELNKIADGDVAKWNEAYNKRHEHANKAELDLIASGDKAKWDTAAINAANAVADLAALTGTDGRIEVAEKAIDALEAIVVDGDNTNAKLRGDITELQGIVKTGADNNAALRSEIDRVAGLVDNTTTGLAATKAIADDAKSKAENAQSRVAAIEGDYLKMADLFIIDCGTATTVTHEMPNA